MKKEREKAQLVIDEVKKAVTGKDDCISKVFATILAGGHILLEDVPGVGKTTLAIAFSRAMALENHRVQFTPDLMPSDILGFSMYHKDTGTFEYHEGPIICNLFLADEINRTSSKTQSALLEVMEEGKVSIDGETRVLPEIFITIATQNPKGSAGTSLLPESQLDRFMVCMTMGYPDLDSEILIAKGKTNKQSIEVVQSVINTEDLIEIKKAVDKTFIHDNIYKYIAQLVAATRENPYIELGISPRGTIACTKMAKAWAFLQNRDYVTPSDVEDIFLDIAKHRIVLNTKARVTHVNEEAVLKEILATVKQPASYMERKDYRG